MYGRAIVFREDLIMGRKSYRTLMVAIYLFLMAGFLYLKPGVAFGREGRIRPFGTQDRESTVFPLWWWVFILAVVSYMTTVWYYRFRV
jgi:hypothetical protein